MIYIYVISALFVGIILGVVLSRRQWKNWASWILIFSLIMLVIVAIQFVRASGGEITMDIEPELWAQFGAFIGSVMIVLTIFFQIISFRKQQVEAKFFELVKYYRENISEMRLRNPFYYQNMKTGRAVDEEFVHGRRVMKTIFEQYKVSRRLAEQIESKSRIKKNCLEYERVNLLFEKYEWKDQTNAEWTERYRINEIAFLITYWGIPAGIDTELRKCLCKLFDNDNNRVSEIIDLVESIPALYECGGQAAKVKIKLTKRNGPIEIKHESNGYIKFFGGHQYHLGHYFRHLYQSVKYIDEQPWWLLSQEEKYGYIKTLRAQMSNYEQALLYVNSLSQLGRKWEYENKHNKELISKYHLIKNLPESFIAEMEPQYFYPKVDYEWKNKIQFKLPPKPFYISLKNIKAFVLGCDPTAFDKNKNQLKFEYVFDLGKNNNPYFAGILGNLELIGLSMENIYVQNLVTDYQDQETSKNKEWAEIAEGYILDRKDEFDAVDPGAQIPVMLTSEILYKVLLNKNQPKYKAKQFYNLEALVPVPAAINRLGRPLFPLYRHPAYMLNRHEGYLEHLKKSFKHS